MTQIFTNLTPSKNRCSRHRANYLINLSACNSLRTLSRSISHMIVNAAPADQRSFQLFLVIEGFRFRVPYVLKESRDTLPSVTHLVTPSASCPNKCDTPGPLKRGAVRVRPHSQTQNTAYRNLEIFIMIQIYKLVYSQTFHRHTRKDLHTSL